MLWLWTLAFSLVCAAGFTILGFAMFGGGEGAWRNIDGWLHWYDVNLRISLAIGIVIHLLHVLSRAVIGLPRLRRMGRRARGFYFSGIPLVGVAVGMPLGLSWADAGWLWVLRDGDANTVAASLLLSTMIGLLFWGGFTLKARQLRAEQQAAEAALKLLQGQIEPHFLFNSLANVVGLIEVEPARARALLESFIAYLRASLGGLRQDNRTMADELTLVRAYVDVLRHRMEDRLTVDLNVPAALLPLPLPALLIQPLVENAIRHGLEPKVEGGHLQVSARAEGSTLIIEVIDDGLGLTGNPGTAGSGTALANIRERLWQQFGTDASLTLAPGEAGRGVCARLTLPLPALPAAPAA